MTDTMTFTFPPDVALWDLDVLSDGAETIAQLSLAALVAVGRGDRYAPPTGRVVVGHGDVPVEKSKAGQITVVLAKLMLGLPGGEQFQPTHGAIGKFGFASAQYTLELSKPWPTRKYPQAIKEPEIDQARLEFWRDGLVVFDALRALSMGGITRVGGPSESPVTMIGPMVAKQPSGGEATWSIDVWLRVPPRA